MDFDPAGLGSTLRAGSDGAIGRLVRTVALSFVGPDRRTRALVVVLSCIHCIILPQYRAQYLAVPGVRII